MLVLLINAERLWRTIQGMLRMTVGRHGQQRPCRDASALPLLHAAAKAGVGAVDTDDLLRKTDDDRERCEACFERYVGKPDG